MVLITPLASIRMSVGLAYQWLPILKSFLCIYIPSQGPHTHLAMRTSKTIPFQKMGTNMAASTYWQHTDFSISTPGMGYRISFNRWARFTNHRHSRWVKTNFSPYPANTLKLTGSTYKFISSHSSVPLTLFSLNSQPFYMSILYEQLPFLISHSNCDFSSDQICINTINFFKEILIDGE